MNPLVSLAATLAIPEIIKGVVTIAEDAYAWVAKEKEITTKEKDSTYYNKIKEEE